MANGMTTLLVFNGISVLAKEKGRHNCQLWILVLLCQRSFVFYGQEIQTLDNCFISTVFLSVL